MRVVIYGGRDFNRIGLIWKALDQLHEKYKFTVVIDGKATGVDSIAHKWAIHNGLQTIREPADWDTYGKAAGPVRNELMITKHNPDMGVAFPGGGGTSNMTSLCLRYGIPLKTVVIKPAKV